MVSASSPALLSVLTCTVLHMQGACSSLQAVPFSTCIELHC